MDSLLGFLSNNRHYQSIEMNKEIIDYQILFTCSIWKTTCIEIVVILGIFIVKYIYISIKGARTCDLVGIDSYHRVLCLFKNIYLLLILQFYRSAMDMTCVCCRCGTLQAGATATLCLPVTGTQNSFHCHCFCCAQPPRMKCFYCNMPRDLGPLESHGACLPDKLHVFVNTEQWPPFPVHTPQPPLIGMVVTLGNAQEIQQLPDNVDGDNEVHEMEETDYIEEEDDFNTMHAIGIVKSELQESAVDVKPRISTKSKWVSIGDIRKWKSCIRCGMVKIKSDGWIKHAQTCGQDPKFPSRKFFIYLHTLSWCNTLVNDNFWEQHSNAVNGKCKVCRSSRLNKEPLPYQPKPPTRKNEVSYAKQRRSRILKNRIKRRQSMAADASYFQNSTNNNAPMRIVECTSLRQND